MSDGRRLVASRAGRIFLIRADGSGVRQLPMARLRSRDEVRDEEAVWSPDGRRLAFVRHRFLPLESGEFGRQVEIWTASPRGTHPRRIWKRYDGLSSDASTPSLSRQSLSD